MGDKGGDEVDRRLEFISEYVLRALKLKPDKWVKLITGDDRHVISRFFDSPKFEYLIFRVNAAGLLTAAVNFPPLSRGKTVYFLRNSPEKITVANYRQMTVGEMSSNVLLELGVLADEVFGPMLCNPENQRGWPKVVVQDMQRHVNDLRNLLYEMRGEMSSQVMLPMPAGVETIHQAESRLKDGDGDKVDLNLKTNIEGAVIKWAQQINDLLKEDSLIAYKRTKFPLPMADVEFYAQRLQNLEGIYNQLRDPRVKKMAHYLESTDSVYLDSFKIMLTNVVAAVVECRDIVIHQKPLVVHFEGVEGCDFSDCKPLIRPMFHCIGLLWGNSRYYCYVEKLIPLLREVCNLMIQQCSNSCDPATLFQGEPDEQILKLRNVLSILKHFTETYEMSRDKVATFFPAAPAVTPVRWSFDFDRVFMRFNVYEKRLKMIESILHATNEFLKLEKVEYSGLRGKIVSTETSKILEDYTLAYQQLSNITYDPADPEDDRFLPDYDKFMSFVNDIDRRLASVFSQAMDDCNNLEQIFKFLQIIGDLYFRPMIQKEMQAKLPKLLELMNKNLDDVKDIFDEEMAIYTKTTLRPMIEPNHPPVAGMLWWINKLRKRITMPMEDFMLFEDPIINSDAALYMKQKHTEMIGYLSALEDKLFKSWAATVPGICKVHLAKHLIYREGSLIIVNFSPELECLLHEIRYLRYLEKAGIPMDAQALYARNEKLQCDLNRLNRSVAWYNDIRAGSHESEVALIEKEISAIDEMWTRGVEDFDWNQDFAEWMEEVYNAMDALQQRVLTAQDNVRRGLANIASWGDVPLYNRRDNTDKLELLALKECETRYVERKKRILQSYDEFGDILNDNFKLFFNIQDDNDSDEEVEEDGEEEDEEVDEEAVAARAGLRAERERLRRERLERRRLREEGRAALQRATELRRQARRDRLERKEDERQARREMREHGESSEAVAARAGLRAERERLRRERLERRRLREEGRAALQRATELRRQARRDRLERKEDERQARREMREHGESSEAVAARAGLRAERERLRRERLERRRLREEGRAALQRATELRRQARRDRFERKEDERQARREMREHGESSEAVAARAGLRAERERLRRERLERRRLREEGRAALQRATELRRQARRDRLERKEDERQARREMREHGESSEAVAARAGLRAERERLRRERLERRRLREEGRAALQRATELRRQARRDRFERKEDERQARREMREHGESSEAVAARAGLRAERERLRRERLERRRLREEGRAALQRATELRRQARRDRLERKEDERQARREMREHGESSEAVAARAGLRAERERLRRERLERRRLREEGRAALQRATELRRQARRDRLERKEDERQARREMREHGESSEAVAARAGLRAERERLRRERLERRRLREEGRAALQRATELRRQARRDRLERKEDERQARREKREHAELAGEVLEEETVEEEELSEDELADIEAERLEEENRLYRESRWTGYVCYVDSLVAGAVMDAIQTSVNLFEKQTDLENGPRMAFMEVITELREPEIFFTPSIEVDDEGGLYDMMQTMMKDMFMQATMFPRIDKNHDYPNYEDEIPNRPTMIELYHEIMKRVKTAIGEAITYIARYEKYANLWQDDRQEVLENFLRYGRVIPPEEFDRLQESGELKEEKPKLEQFQKEIYKYTAMYDELSAMPPSYLFNGWLRLELKRLNQAIMNIICKWSHLFKQNLVDHVHTSLDELEKFIIYATKELSVTLDDDDYEGLLQVMRVLNEVKAKVDANTEQMFEPLREIIYVLKEYGVEFDEETYEQLELLPERWRGLVKLATVMKNNVAPLQANQAALIAKRVMLINLRLQMYRDTFKNKSFFLQSCLMPYPEIDLTHLELTSFEETLDSLNKSCTLFDIQPADVKNLKACRRELKLIKQLWDYYNLVVGTIESWKTTPWKKIDADGMDQECKRFTKDIRQLDKEMRSWEPYLVIESMIKNLMTSLRAVTELQNPSIKDRHWIELMQATKVKFHMDDSTTLADLLALNLHLFEEEVKTIVDKSVKESAMEKTLRELEVTWAQQEFDYSPHDRTKVLLPKASEELVELLEDNQNQVQTMLSSKFIGYYETEVMSWSKKLGSADAVIALWFEVQRKWQYLESIFVGSDDIRAQLPEDSRRFDFIDREFKTLLADIGRTPNVITATNKPGLLDKLEELMKGLSLCEKALNNYLETKRLAYPRFYFVSSADLLDILSNGNNPPAVCRHLSKLYDNLAVLVFPKGGSKMAFEMISKENEEHVPFKKPCCDCSGKVEIWLNRVTDCMRYTLKDLFERSVKTYEDKPREEWVFDWPAQPALVGTQIWWTTETNQAFAKLEEGYEGALKDYQKKQIAQLSSLIMLLLGDLTVGDRQKIMTICTIDVHSRDVVAKLIVAKVETSNAFQWQSQLRHRWDLQVNSCYANICDAQFLYDYEYLGNTPRLVITPLTDRCYITLTQSLHLVMGGAPAGPAGTGKTETTKDLGRALGIMVYVFNCSEQMDYKSCGNIYKGLAQTGAWGCFDEFNRISVEVLSVVSVQVKSVLDSIKAKKKRFDFMGEVITLISTIGMFITMNPGYAGRTELPENLKALFRPCAMVVPDFELICEIMLVAEGFQEARLLARKFITLYTLCRELLSKQDHYDWGLRAIKSVLVVAGSLKRGDRLRPEDQVLMRALRDFNIPKIVTDDRPVFMGLIGDLFPALDVPRKRDMDFEQKLIEGALSLTLQPEAGFILKMVQLVELFAVRHSVFIVGFAGTGKSMVWQCLNRTYFNMKLKPYYNDLDPKAVTNDELFGIINPATREWKDGLFSTIMRDMANMTGDGPKWIVLDGDIDPMWIESLNTLMDDNKVLTLASNERIALTKSMRLLFEIATLRTATPATVSRAGILYINPQDLGWNPFVASWIEKTFTEESDRAMMTILFDKYIPPLLESGKKYKRITPLTELQQIQLTCYLLECFLNKTLLPSDCPKEWYEIYFVFSCVWGFGSALFQDQLVDWRNEFSKWFSNEFKSVKFPSTGNVFSFFIDPETKKFLPWSEKVESFELDPDLPLQSCLVSTSETTRIRFFMDLLIAKEKPVMLVGSAGSGKTVSVAAKLQALPDSYALTNVPFNFYTTSEMMQKVLEKPLEKKSGRIFGPPGSKFMIYFVDDMNMPEVDLYGTVQPHTLVRQFMDYKHWYDRQKLSLKEISNCMFVSCMNPTAGSFTIDPRLQRHFCTFAVSFPGLDACIHIYKQILHQHLINPLNKFSGLVARYSEPLVLAALALHTKLTSIFLPTAVKFHYIFNLRDLANIFQGMLFTTGDAIKLPSELIRLWMHEATRVYCDKLVESDDSIMFQKTIIDVIKKNFEEYDENVVFEKPLIYCHFAEGVGDPKYFPIKDWPQIKKLLDEALSSYNDLVATMNLVLFEDAMYHICRINRILEAPRGNALLVGVGGSGKQSLSRLSAFISSLEVFQVQLRKGYGINDLKLDLAQLYMKSGVKNIGTVFLMTDGQVAEERFLVLINDLLASGEIPELFADDETENIINALRGETKATGVQDTKENCWKFFINRVRSMLKVVLCFSPVGATLRVRARKFPSIVNCTAINWFHEWPQDALRSVSRRFLAEVESLPVELVESVSTFMSHVHRSVNDMSGVYYQNERRYNYTTPKTFLEQIALYSKLLNEKTTNLKLMITRLENGLEKLASCAADVAVLKVTLADQEVILKVKNRAAEALIEVVGAESEKVSKEKAFAAEEEKKVKVIEEDVTIKAKICADDLAKAEPALMAAQAALDTLNKNNLTELKSFGSPPDAVVNVTAGVLVLFAKKGKVPKDRSWKACKLMMAKVDQFLNDLVFYNKENIHPEIIKAIQPYIKNPEFNPDFIRSKSAAAAGLCAWVINIVKFYEVYEVVEPKRRALNAANAELHAAREKLAFLTSQIAELEEKLDELLAAFQVAVNDKMKCQAEADATNATIDLANRLVNGLASEKIRWTETVVRLKDSGKMLPGDVLLVTAFISYVGCFMRQYRLQLMNQDWMPFLVTVNPKIETTEGLDPLSMLTDDAQVATWNNEGLPTDTMSKENATILTNSARWPLMIDPQLQGVKWIKSKYGDALVVLRLSQRNYLDKIERAVSDGSIVLLENIDETVDAVLEPLLGRVLIRKGKVLKMGDREIDYHPNFRLIIQTKLANPHYQPEMQAQCTLINFTVTKDGLEEQLLGEVVKAERPDLAALRSGLTKQQNDFKITLKTLEDDLLKRLSSAGPDILSDSALVINLETTKKTAADIEIKVEEGKITAVKIDEARERYRRAATRASLLYFILNDLYKISPMYQFSLKAYSIVFKEALTTAPAHDDLDARVAALLDSITFSVYVYTSRGLFERDKLIFLFQITLQILQVSGQIDPVELDFLLKYAVAPSGSPFSWLSNNSWGGIQFLSNLDAFENLDKDMEGASKRWQNFTDGEAPERDKLPGDWKNKTSLQRLCIMRALRPDRMSYATSCFCEENLGTKYVEARTPPFEKSYQESSSTTPVFFILSPGVDPLKDIEKLGKKMGFSTDRKNIHIVSLGQGQEVVAEEALGVGAAAGHWVILQNIHLVQKWLSTLEKRMEECFENPQPEYRLFLSAEPAADPAYHIIPQGILESAIKITNEPPIGMWANLHKSLDNFSQETMEMCSKEAEFKSILFALCYFHAVVAERRKFGPQGWNRMYPFNFGDLTICVYVLFNYLEANSRVPWEDLRYLFGEIMYGGHITDDWDRRLCRTFLSEYMQPELVDGEQILAPGFTSPPNSDYAGYHSYIDDYLPDETPYLYGLHPNAEIGFLTTVSERLFRTVFEMQPRDTGAQAGGGVTKEEQVRAIIDDIMDRVPEPFNIQELMGKVEELTPFTIVAFQEAERMNMLMGEIRRSLKETELGLKGELTITNDMESLMESLFMDTVPAGWTKLAYPSLLGLAAWFSDLCQRLVELENWTGDFNLPPAVLLAGFFNPQSFLTAIMQQTARKNEWPLDKICLNCDVTNKFRRDFTAPPREGANVHGLYMEGARWDMALGSIVESRMKELFPVVPVIFIKAVTQDKQETRSVYECPVYKIRLRGPTFVWTFNLKTKDKPSRWILAGVALLLGV